MVTMVIDAVEEVAPPVDEEQRTAEQRVVDQISTGDAAVVVRLHDGSEVRVSPEDLRGLRGPAGGAGPGSARVDRRARAAHLAAEGGVAAGGVAPDGVPLHRKRRAWRHPGRVALAVAGG
jgi:hypothetical protein